MRSSFLLGAAVLLAGGLLLAPAEARADCFWWAPKKNTCFPYSCPTFGYTPTTWRPWPFGTPETTLASPAPVPPAVAPLLPMPRPQPMPDRVPEETLPKDQEGAGKQNSQVGPQGSGRGAAEALPPPPALVLPVQQEVTPSANRIK